MQPLGAPREIFGIADQIERGNPQFTTSNPSRNGDVRADAWLAHRWLRLARGAWLSSFGCSLYSIIAPARRDFSSFAECC